MRKRFEYMNFIRLLSVTVLSLCLVLSGLYIPPDTLIRTGIQPVYAGGRITLSSAKNIAVAKSDKIEALDIKIDKAKSQKDSAVRSLREKERSMNTFRWSPLLDFKFPTKPNEAEGYEFAFKPIQLEYNIKTLEHQIIDEQLKEYEKVSNIYVDIVKCFEESSYLEKRISNLKVSIKKCQARNSLGEVSDDTLDQMQKRLDSLESKKTQNDSKLQRSKEKLGRELTFSVTSGYSFEHSFTSADMGRKNIEYLQTYALDRDETVFEATQAKELALISMRTNYSLMRQQYGNDINMISSYVDQALAGSSINKRAFKSDYDKFLKKIDEPWQGKRRILFFSFPKEWIKGDIDGIRFVEDDPYVLHAAVLDFESALKEEENAKQELKDSVEDGYDTYIGARNAYRDAREELMKLQNQVAVDEIRNLLGTLSQEEYDAEVKELEEQQSAYNDAVATYTSTLYSYDRTCCGGVSKFWHSQDLDDLSGNGTGSMRNLSDDLDALNALLSNQAHYGLRPIIDSDEFILYVDAPKKDEREFRTDENGKEVKNQFYFPYNVTDYELRCDGRLIGERKKVGESIRHLTLSLKEVDQVAIRLFDGSKVICDCTIDPTKYYGVLNIVIGYEKEEGDDGDVIGTYTVEDQEMTDMVELRFTFDQDKVVEKYAMSQQAAYYNLSAEKNIYLFSDRLISIDKVFSYLKLIKGDLDKLTMRLFDKEGRYIGGARFDTVKQRIMVDDTITVADLKEKAARELIVKEKLKEYNDEKDRMSELLKASEEATGGMTDSESVAYYKDRIAQLDALIANAASNVTDEEIAAAIESRYDEIETMVQEMQKEEGKSEEEKFADVEMQMARAKVLTNAAKKYVGQRKYEEIKANLETRKQNAVMESQEAYAAWQELESSGASAVDILAAKREYEEKKKELDRLETQLRNLTPDNAFRAEDISEKDLDEALRNHSDEIYSLAAHDLTDAMLYSSEGWQSALAYAESNGVPASEENVKYIMEHMDGINEARSLREQSEKLQTELENARTNAAQLRGTGRAVDAAAADQLDRMAEKYEKEIKNLKEKADNMDPVIKLKSSSSKESADTDGEGGSTEKQNEK